VSEQNGWIHDQVAELLSAYIDGEVTAAERGLVEAHLASCDVCGRDLATLRQTVALLRQLPQVAAPRPFTLRESDVRPLRPTRPIPIRWQSGWLRGAVAAAAMLLCVAMAGGALLLERGMLGAPAEPSHVALQAPAATQAAGAAPGARGEAEKQAENSVPAPTVPAQPQREAAAEATAPQAATAAPAAKALKAETPPEPTPSPSAAAAAALAEPPAPLATPAPLAPSLAAPSAPAAPPSPSTYGEASPTASPQAAPEMAPQQLDQGVTAAGASPTATPETRAAATALWEVQDLSLVIEPGVITASGRLPVGRGLRLAAQLLRDGQPTDWITPEARPTVTGVDGWFSLRLQARAGAPDFDLFAVAPATYVIRVYVVPSGVRPGEAHITFDTYRPPAAEPTATMPAPATPTPSPARSAAPADVVPAPPVGRRRRALAALLNLCRAGAAVLFSAGLAAIYSLRIGSDLRQ
jgi:hypothetical protein